MKSWRALVLYEMKYWGESWEDVEEAHIQTSEAIKAAFEPFCEEEWDIPFDHNEYKDGCEGAPFCVWTKNRVYFPACYDGREWCASVPRHPGYEQKTVGHIGGGSA